MVMTVVKGVCSRLVQPQDLAFPDEPFRAQPPGPAAPRPFHIPPVQPFAIGPLAAYLVEQHALPIVSLELCWDGGAATDPPGRAGLASLAMALLAEGTTRLDKPALSAALADIGSTISAYATDDLHGLTLASLAPHVPATFELLAELLARPGLRPADLERLRGRRIEAVRQARGSPASIPGRVMPVVAYGAAHPLGAVTTEASLAAITLDEVRAQLAHLEPGAARLFVVGDAREASVRALVDAVEPSFGGASAPGTRPTIPPPAPPPGRIFFVDVPGAPQATVLRVAPGPRRTAPDYLANTLLAAVLGGGFTSRINMNLRERMGVAYGARGGFSYGRDASLFVVSAQVQAEAAYEALCELHREVDALATGRAPVTADELAREQAGLVRALPGRFATAQAALGQYRALVYYGLPLDTYATYADGVAAVTLDDVARAAAAHLAAPARYLVVGDGRAEVAVGGGRRCALAEALAELAQGDDVGDGGLVALDADGAPRNEALAAAPRDGLQ